MRSHFYRPQLDVVRFCAFFAVFNHHVLPRDGNSGALNMIADACGFGLSLFFVLSAYLISLVLLREYESTGGVRLQKFYIRRMLRIWPLYLVGLGLGVLRAWNHGVLAQQKTWFLAALLLAGNLVPATGILMSHLWSISVEEQFYLIFPSPAKFGRGGMLGVALLLILVANGALIHFGHVHADLDQTVWFNSLVQFEMFAAGILLALLDNGRAKFSTAAAVALILVSAVTALAVQRYFHLKTQGATAESAVAVCAGYALLAVSCCLFIAGMQRIAAWAPFTYLGKISYGLYVFHIPAIVLVADRFHFISLDILASLALTVLLAAVSYQVLERPFLRAKRKYEMVTTRTA